MVIVVLAVGLPVILMMLGQDVRQGVYAEARVVSAQNAQALMEEIRSRRWDENAVAPPYSIPLGPEAGEVRTACSGLPNAYDDVDDYNGYAETCSGYSVAVQVCYVNSANLNACVGGPTDFKMIRLTVTHQLSGTTELTTMMSNH